MRRDLQILAAIAVLAFAVRVYPAWQGVLGGPSVSYLETDAWYHVRLVENQVRNYPWRVTLDPYAAAGGEFVPIAPLYDTLTATAAVIVHGRHASTEAIERLAAFIPPILGTIAIVVAWALGRRVFGSEAGLLAAALLAILPGHFLDRTALGFVDHHALEALLALVTLLAIASAFTGEGDRRRRQRIAALATGVALGLYLLTWASGAFLIGILGAWLLTTIIVARPAADVIATARLLLVASFIALVMVLIFQDARMHRYGSQVLGLIGLMAMSGLVAVLHRDGLAGRVISVGALGMAVAIAVAGVWWWRPSLSADVAIDLLRFTPDQSRMNVLEARPLFLYSGEWRWSQPWEFFRTGIYVGVAALVLFVWRLWKERRPIDLLIWVYTLGTLLATFGQNRFGYYLVPGCALLGGWLTGEILRWGGWFREKSPATDVPLQREVALAIVLAGVFAPNLAPATLLKPRNGALDPYWIDAMQRLHDRTPPPFAAEGGEDFYYARYPRDRVPRPAYTVMNWWDQGYLILQRARRVPVANPTQSRAVNSARFYAETDERQAAALLALEGAKTVLVDWELPFRLTKEGRVMGRFQSVLDWAGGVHANYYEVCYRLESGKWTPVWVFYEPYYRSMVYRLEVAGGAASEPQQASTVVTFADRTDARGVHFRELVSERTYATYREALTAAAAAGPQAAIVGLDPWRTAFPLEALQAFEHVDDVRGLEQMLNETPVVRIFRVRD